MKPLFVLLIVFAVSLLISNLTQGRIKFNLCGRVAMSAMLVFTAIGHFLYTKGMTMMMPPFFPLKTELVYLTGVLEVLFAIGLLLPDYKRTIGWLLIGFFLLLLPANIYAAIKQVDYQNGTYDGHGISYLWFRIPLQVFFIVWTYCSSIRPEL